MPSSMARAMASSGASFHMAVVQNQRAETFLSAGDDAAVAAVPVADVVPGDLIGEEGAKLGLGKRDGLPDAGLARVAVKVGGDQQALTGEGVFVRAKARPCRPKGRSEGRPPLRRRPMRSG